MSDSTRAAAGTAARANRARAFSLLESLIAASMLITGLAGFAMAMSSMSRQQEHQRHRAAAGTVAGNVMEELVAQQDAGTLSPGLLRRGTTPRAAPRRTGVIRRRPR